MSLHCNDDKSYLFVNRKKIYKFKANSKNFNFPSQFRLGSISNKFGSNDIKQVSFKGIVYDFSVDYNAIDKSDIFSIRKYLMVKNNI